MQNLQPIGTVWHPFASMAKWLSSPEPAVVRAAIEGEKYGIRVNCLAPSAATRMTEGILTAEDLALLTPESVTPGLLYLVSRNAPTKTVLCAGAGSFACSNITLTDGVFVGVRSDAADLLAAKAEQLVDRTGDRVPHAGI